MTNSALLKYGPRNENIDASTVKSRFFSITNTSDAGEEILRAVIKIPKPNRHLFDVTGTQEGKEFVVDSEGGIGLYFYRFLSLREDTYHGIELFFRTFKPGKRLAFSIDVNPTSIQALLSTDPSNLGGISQSDVIEPELSLDFADGTTLEGQIYKVLNRSDASQVQFLVDRPYNPNQTTLAPQDIALLSIVANHGVATTTIRIDAGKQTITEVSAQGSVKSADQQHHAHTIYAGPEVINGHHEGEPETFQINNRWSTTATDGDGLGQGDPTTLTWTIVDDGTPISPTPSIPGESSNSSDLVAFLGGIYGIVTDDNNHTDEVWFPLIQSALNRWGQISGITYIYVSDDDGSDVNSNVGSPGLLGSVADVRIGGHDIDGNAGILAYNYFPNGGDMVIDTNDNWYGNTGFANGSLGFRNVIAHEAGHGLGLSHIESNNGTFLMEPFLQTTFDGPQIDDILAVQRNYGDALEKTNSGIGNDTLDTAFDLGVFTGSALTIGTDASDTLQVILPTQTDFVSIDDNSDTDVYSFTVTSDGLFDFFLNPRGPTYQEGSQGGSQSIFNTKALSDLALRVLDTDGITPLGVSNNVGLGVSESITHLNLSAGSYFVEVTGANDQVQLYDLSIESNDEVPLPIAIRINAGGETVIDSQGQEWLADTLFSGGQTFETSATINGAPGPEQALFQTERYGNFSYDIPVNNGTYDITLNFAEIYWTTPGARLFDVSIEGQPLINNLDIFDQVGANTALIQPVSGILVSDGELNIDFSTEVDNAKLSALEVLSSGTPQSPVIQFSQASYLVNEDIGDSMAVTLTRFGDTDASSEVQVIITGGNATAGSDYDDSSFPLTVPFGPGATSETIIVPILPDDIEEDTETIDFSVTSVDNATIGFQETTTLQILDDDSSVTVVRINAGGSTFVDELGQIWQADQSFSGGSTFSSTADISNTNNDVLFQTERYGNFSYDIPVANGTYTINLNFAEIFWTSPGARVFDVTVEGQSVIDDLDIFTQLGANTALIQEFLGISVTDGELNIEFVTEVDNAKLSALEVLSNDTAEVSILANDADAAEPADDGQFTVILSNPSDTDTVISYTVSGDATVGSDYIALSGTVTILANQTSATIDVSVIDESLLEDNETVTVMLDAITSGDSNISIGAANSDTVTIADDDTAEVSIVANDANAAEPTNDGQFTVSLSNPSDTDTIVSYTVSGTATPGGDYNTLSGSVTITAGDLSAPIDVTVIDDLEVEGNENVTVSLDAITAGNANIVVGATNSATVTIADDDLPLSNEVNITTIADAAEPDSNGQFAVSLSAIATTDTVISYTVSGSATPGGDYNTLSGSVTIIAGALSAPIDITVIDDFTVEADESVMVSLDAVTAGDANVVLGSMTSATLTIADDDTPPAVAVRINAGGGTVIDSQGQEWLADTLFSGGQTFETSATINGAPEPEQARFQTERYGNFSYDIPVSNGTYDITLNFAEIYWTTSGARLFDVTVEGQPLINDLDIFDQVGANTALIQPVPEILVSDGELNINFSTEVDNAKLSALEVLSSGTPQSPVIQFSQASYLVNEDSGDSMAVTLTRFGDTDASSEVQVTITGGNATAGSDYDDSSFPLTVIFDPDATSETITIPILPDDLEEGVETIDFNVISVDNAAIGFQGTTTLQILDDDSSAPAVRINAGGANYTDVSGNLWLADQYFTNGSTFSVPSNVEIFKTEDDELYRTERYATDLSYDIPLTAGNYIVNLHFAEIYWDDFNQRIFDVFLEGELAVDDLDIFARSKNAFFPGKNSALVLSIPQVSVTDGFLDFDTTTSVDHAKLSAIEIVPLMGAQVLLFESDGGTNVTEGGAEDTYTLVLNTQPTADVTVTIQPDSQLSTDKTTIVFDQSNWNLPQTITITAVDDSFEEGTQTVPISHTVSSADLEYDGLSLIDLPVTITDNDVVNIDFNQQTVVTGIDGPTTAAWGPDGRLYVGTITGQIIAYTFDESYSVTDTQVIDTLQGISNPNILGIAFNPYDTSNSPTIYVSHSQLFANGGISFPITELSPYSGQVSILEGPTFDSVQPLITGLPVSNHDHGINGLTFDNAGDLYIAVGGNTNAGITADAIGGIPESPFTAAILKADITNSSFNGAVDYELPPDFIPPPEFTFDPGTMTWDPFDPADSQVFGDIVTVVPGVDISVYASGLRNPYDLVYTTQGLMYATDNGANDGFGDVSTGPDTQEPVVGAPDELNRLVAGEYYGHPNRNRGFTDPRQNVYYDPFEASIPGVYTAPLAIADASTNGIDEYRAATFGGQLQGNLIAQQWDSKLYSFRLSPDGNLVVNTETFNTVTDGLDVLTGPGGAIIGVDFTADAIDVAIPNDPSVTGPTAYDIFPWRAPATGGDLFVIGGENFDTSNTTVTIGGEVVTLTSVSDHRIAGILPALSSPGGELLDVTVISGGVTSVLTDAYLPLGDPSSEFIGEATFSVTVNSDNIQISNFGNDSFQISNTGDKKIAQIDIDVTNALYPDSVFDPFGLAGDTISKPLTIDTDGGTGVVPPSNASYVGAGRTSGYQGLQLVFQEAIDGGFDPGETIGFSVDMDPNSVAGAEKGLLDAGTDPPWDVGGVSGAELIGSTYTVTFTDGTTATGQLQGVDNQGGAQGVASQGNPGPSVSLTVNGLSAGDVGIYDANANSPSVIVNGPVGLTARVVLTKGFIQPVTNEFFNSADPDDLAYAPVLQAQLDALAASEFPANNAVEFQTVDIQLTGEEQDISGLFDFSNVEDFNFAGEDQLPLGFVASIIDPSNGNLPLGEVTQPIYLAYTELEMLAGIPLGLSSENAEGRENPRRENISSSSQEPVLSFADSDVDGANSTSFGFSEMSGTNAQIVGDLDDSDQLAAESAQFNDADSWNTINDAPTGLVGLPSQQGRGDLTNELSDLPSYVLDGSSSGSVLESKIQVPADLDEGTMGATAEEYDLTQLMMTDRDDIIS